MIHKSPYPDIEIPDLPFHEFVLGRARALGDKPALIDGPTGRTLSYAALAAGVERVAAGLAARGFAKGDVFAIFAPNSPEFAVAYLGAAAAGGVITTISPLAPLDDLAKQLQNSGARYLLTIPPFLDRAIPAAKRAGIEEVFVFGDAEGATPFAALTSSEGRAPLVEFDSGEDLVALPYSSGTTGLCKGVMLTHRNLVANVMQAAAMLHIRDDDRVIALMPFFHIYGMVVVMGLHLSRGATLVTMPKFEMEAFLAHLQAHRITHVCVAPPVIVALAKHPALDTLDLTHLRILFSGAAPMDAELQKACAARLGCEVMQGYGMTEASPVTHATSALPGKNRPGSVGEIAPNTECRIVDVATGADAASGMPGELWVRGPQVMKGYLADPAATAITLDAESWLHTGDIGCVDADGYFTIVDRLKELIKYKGYQVPPAELEALLLTHPCVADAAVIGVPDEEAGESPKAFVVLKGNATAQSLMDFVSERVAPYKRIRTVEFIDAIPKSPSGKILRRVLKERAPA
jgi:acyl-CoA synthetase (AMP-forming)/AMP-acid ligase II